MTFFYIDIIRAYMHICLSLMALKQRKYIMCLFDINKYTDKQKSETL